MSEEKRALPGAGQDDSPVITPTVAGQERLTRWQRLFWILVSIVCGAYIIIPVDFIPEIALGLVGLLDDGVAGMVLLFSLSKLGINIPLLSRFVNARAGKGGSGEKNVN